MFQIIFVDKDTVKGNPASLDDKTRFERPKGAEGRPIHRHTGLWEVLGPMGKERRAGFPGRHLVILQQAMRFFELAAKAFLRINERYPSSHPRPTGLFAGQESLKQ